MLSDAQKTELTRMFETFVSTLNKEQLTKLYFRLDDLHQYGPEARDLFTKITRAKIEEVEHE